MKNIILDTNIILKQPKVLSLQMPGIRFIIPKDILFEIYSRAITRGDTSDERINLIKEADRLKTVSISDLDSKTYQQYASKFRSKLKGADLAILVNALYLKDKGEQAIIASRDIEIIKLANEYGIEIISEINKNFLSKKFVKAVSEHQEVVKEIHSYENKERRKFIFGILLGAVVTGIGTITVKNIEKITTTINVWGTVILIIFLGIALFVFREKSRLSYGAFEFFAGVITIIMLFLPTNFTFSKIDFNLDFNVKLLGGLYIMVRGQDNIVKSLKDKKIGIYLKEKYGIGK